MSEIHLRADARADLEEAASWHESKSAGLAKRFLDEVERTLDSVEAGPYRYQCVHGEARRALIRRFPFAVFYVVESDKIVVFAILHASRSPSHWRKRL